MMMMNNNNNNNRGSLTTDEQKDNHDDTRSSTVATTTTQTIRRRIIRRRSSSTGDLIECDHSSNCSSSNLMAVLGTNEGRIISNSSTNNVSLIPVMDSNNDYLRRDGGGGEGKRLTRRISRSFNDLFDAASSSSLSYFDDDGECTYKETKKGLTPVVTHHELLRSHHLFNINNSKKVSSTSTSANTTCCTMKRKRMEKRSSYQVNDVSTFKHKKQYGGSSSKSRCTSSHTRHNKRRRLTLTTKSFIANDTFYSGSESCSSDDEIKEMERLRYTSSPTGGNTACFSLFKSKNTLVEDTFQKQAKQHLERIRQARAKMSSTMEQGEEPERSRCNDSTIRVNGSITIVNQSSSTQTNTTTSSRMSNETKEMFQRACNELRHYAEGNNKTCMSFHPSVMKLSSTTAAATTAQSSKRSSTTSITFHDVEQECKKDILNASVHLGLAAMIVATTTFVFI